MRYVLLALLSQVLVFGAIDIEPYQNRWTRAEIEEKLGNFLQKEGHIGSYFSLTDEAFTLYNAPEIQSDRTVDFCLKLAKEKKGPENLQRRENLVGVKIAIDPGHLGGPFARLEQRFIDLPPSLDREEIQFDEGTLSLHTALYLKTLLEKEGAHVMLTRDKIGEGVYPEPFFAWLGKKTELWKGEISLSRIFCKYYNPLDLRARAEKINAFAPDLTLMIHYNSEDPPAGAPSNNTLIASNYNMVFVPGGFCRGELTEYENRCEFIRLLATEDLEKSLHLSREILRSFGKHLKVPIVSESDGARYLNNVCLKLEEGIYARNLALTRLVHGPICYGETLIQNNIDECLHLSRKDFVIDGKPCSSRIKQVAEAYFEGIKNYFNEKP